MMDFTPGEAKGLVIGATAAAGIMASANQLANSQPPDVRVAVGTVIAAALLYALADWAPSFAGALALLLLTGAVLTNGVELAQRIRTATGN